MFLAAFGMFKLFEHLCPASFSQGFGLLRGLVVPSGLLFCAFVSVAQADPSRSSGRQLMKLPITLIFQGKAKEKRTLVLRPVNVT